MFKSGLFISGNFCRTGAYANYRTVFFREARFRKPAGRIFRPSFNPFRKFFRRKRRLAEEDISNNFEAAAATRPFRRRHSRRRAGSARPAASARAQKNRHRQRCRTPFQVYREETTPDPSWGPCLRGSKEPESRSCPRCSRSGRCSPAASAAAAWHVRG